MEEFLILSRQQGSKIKQPILFLFGIRIWQVVLSYNYIISALFITIHLEKQRSIHVKHLFDWYKNLSQEGKKFGHLVNGSKSWLIVKLETIANEAERVFGDEVNITTDGHCHLRTIIGSQEHKDRYCRESAPSSLHRIHKGVQVQVHLLYANNLIIWWLCQSHPRNDQWLTCPNIVWPIGAPS